MSPEDIMDTRLGQSSECMTGSSISKWKWRDKKVENVDIICDAMEYAND